MKDDKKFPIDVFPDVVGRFCSEFAHASKAVPEYVACGVLAAVSSIAADSTLKVKTGYIEHPNLYLAIVGKPSLTKSAPLKAALGPLRSIQKEQFKNYEKEFRIWENKFNACVKKREQAELLEEKPIKPIVRITTKGTMEGLRKVLKHNEVNGNMAHTIYYQDELNSFFTDMDKYRNGKGSDLTEFLTLYNGGEIIENNKHSELHIGMATVTVIGSIQPSVLREAMEVKGNGLIERFLFAINNKEPVASSIFDEIEEDTMLNYSYYMGDLIDNYQRCDFHFRDHDIKLKIQEVYNWFHGIGAKHESGAFKKWEINFHKLLIILSVLHMKTEIDIDVIEKAEKLIKYFAMDWLVAYEMTEKSEVEVIQEELFQWIKRDIAVSLTEINRKKKFQRKKAVVEEALDNLITYGQIMRRSSKSGGRPKVSFSIREHEESLESVS